ncbi:hypothetical protein ESY86_11535 [Subsaximicrobium wynnwilliamsii]|uniref:Uncharacterized protein n=1 Tax=Subsaximicrobium wynnwilliamsii TaxID=291179 RepID=A0A5C6ZFK3_9FLAO|nr:hypothetical protein [Subsaximicrobium wynnwilliamsii]TXD83114.1 hypothetical protein ESY87_11570 [Subsaximicrobium wynnwilliamsii]TXD88858.1 hypothetical protein ESY86_11535 [Subsaximicrobium wynnwilliamsii]TXE02931.1 hypothetical protein ESY88_10590 [Subsaximicrobium wynnwilliamsii]
MHSQTNEQALESTIEKKLTGTTLETLKAEELSVDRVNESAVLYPAGNGYFIGQNSLIDYTVFISGVAQPKLPRGNLSAVKALAASQNDLNEISRYIETTSQKFSPAIGLKQEIEKLKEYKGSLINGVVTGKVRVCQL